LVKAFANRATLGNELKVDVEADIQPDVVEVVEGVVLF